MAIDWLIVAEFYSLRTIFFRASNDIGTPTFVPGPGAISGMLKSTFRLSLVVALLRSFAGGPGIH
jgi:hypothetical protein